MALSRNRPHQGDGGHPQELPHAPLPDDDRRVGLVAGGAVHRLGAVRERTETIRCPRGKMTTAMIRPAFSGLRSPTIAPTARPLAVRK